MNCTDLYLESFKNKDVKDFVPLFQYTIKLISKYKTLDSNTKILEIGSGTGWFLILGKLNGLDITGLELKQELARFASNWALKYGVKLDIKIGNIESFCEENKYDVIIAHSVFEHVRNYDQGLKNVFKSLKEGGIFYFVSTNKFAIKQGEYSLPFYSWLPNKLRYKLRCFLQGQEIMEEGIDFNQFTYYWLRKYFREQNYTRVLDMIDFIDTDILKNPSFLKIHLIKLAKKIKPLKNLILLFAPVTEFICIK
jgi:2-polyprenyl-3-methyl-5-hydroxy-6-metoxy-1,4-benzoquinol methylase